MCPKLSKASARAHVSVDRKASLLVRHHNKHQRSRARAINLRRQRGMQLTHARLPPLLQVANAPNWPSRRGVGVWRTNRAAQCGRRLRLPGLLQIVHAVCTRSTPAGALFEEQCIVASFGERASAVAGCDSQPASERSAIQRWSSVALQRQLLSGGVIAECVNYSSLTQARIYNQTFFPTLSLSLSLSLYISLVARNLSNILNIRIKYRIYCLLNRGYRFRHRTIIKYNHVRRRSLQKSPFHACLHIYRRLHSSDLYQ